MPTKRFSSESKIRKENGVLLRVEPSLDL